MELLVKDGILVTSGQLCRADLLVREGKIAAIGTELPAAADTMIVDAANQYVLPGAVDVHTHLELESNGICSADDYFAGTRAAACGGVTTIFDFVTQEHGEGILAAVARRRLLCAPKACVDYAFHVALTDLTPEVLAEFSAAAKEGITSYKIYMVYRSRNMMMNDADICRALQRTKDTGTLLAVHAENEDVIEMKIEQFKQTGKHAAWYHYLSRPEAVEAEADIRAIHWAKMLHAPLYIVHLANAEGARAVRSARDDGYAVYAETCPQYLHFTSAVYRRPDGRNFVCSPAIKGAASRAALWQGLKDGYIKVVATDHCPFRQADKDRGKADFTKIPNGCMGVETMYPYMLSEALQGRISLQRAVEVCAENPARIFGCTQKGSLVPGKDADFVLFAPRESFTVTQAAMHSDCDYTIWEGVKLQGRILSVYARGQLVCQNGTFLGQAGTGQFVRCIQRI